MADSVDIFPPPAEAIEVSCLHCGRVYMSDLMIPVEIDSETHWMCPVPHCGAMGYLMDIFPTDAEEEDRLSDTESDDEIDESFDSSEFDVGQEIADEVADRGGDFDPPREWSPDAENEEESDCFELDEGPDPVYFTREEFEAAKAAGVYDQAVEEARAQWRFIHEDAPLSDTPRGDGSIREDDIPF